EVSNIAENKLGRELTDLPVAISSRSTGSTSAFTTLTTQPGVEVDNNGNLSVAGSRPSMLSMSIDGISSVSPRNSAPIAELFPSFDGIAEIHVSEINNTAEFGGVSDITTISKSGGNSFHGGAYENNQNTDYDARNTFSATVPKLDLNDFGFFIGGPVILPKIYNGHNKTFFFGDYEGLRLPKQTVVAENVPTLAMRQGILPSTVIDPTNGNPFPNNTIPLSRISPISLAALQYLYPTPNTGSATSTVGNFVENFPTAIHSDQTDVRVDQVINSNQTAFFRYTYKNKLGATTPTGSALIGTINQPETDEAITGAHNWVLTAHLVNEFRVGYSKSDTANLFANGTTAATYANEIGLTSYLPEAPPAGSAVPNFKISGFQSTGGNTSSIAQTSTLQFLDNVTWTRGSHTIKTGVDYRYMKALYTNVFASTRLGSYTFNNSVTKGIIGNPFGAFLLGDPDSMSLSTVLNPNSNGYANAYAGFIQDDWKVTPRLTVNYGMRYEYHPMFNDANHNTANFLPNYNSIQNGVYVAGAVVIPNEATSLVNPAFAQSLAPMPILTASQAGIPDSLRYSQKTDFAPRIGFAYRVTGDGKTVIRGGYGHFIESELGNLLDAAWAVEASDLAIFTNSIVGGKPQYTFPYPFPANLAQPGTQEFDLSSNLHYKDPFVQQWNFTFERDLGFETGFRLSYDGSHGRNLGLTDNPDQVPVNTVGFAKAQAYAPYPLLAQIVEETNGGRSNYNAVTVSINKRMSKGLQFQVSYNFAKNLADNGGYNPTAFAGSGGGQTTNFYDPNLDYGNVAFTRRQRFQTTFLYESPFSHTSNKFVNMVAGQWELAGVLLFQTGPFMTVLANGADPSGTNFVNIQGNGRADIVSGANVVPTNQSIYNWINAAAYAIPANNIGRFGDSPVGSVVGPGTQAVSLSLFRSFKIREKATFRFGASASNALNHPNYGLPGLTLGTSSFGIITSMQTADGAGPRTVQLTGRVTF
ncbi:MAG TPA: TonB-dependent receptor, partial [Bryobacteraceae bacterium]|nr:TonB-dependent receptor [Bryobacteraceae bacterium]